MEVQLTLKINNKVIELSLVEVLELREQLNKLLGVADSQPITHTTLFDSNNTCSAGSAIYSYYPTITTLATSVQDY